MTPAPVINPFIVGADLSSSKLAFVCRHEYKRNFKVAAYDLGRPFTSESCAKALDASLDYLGALDGFFSQQVERLAYIEAPVIGRGGTRTTLVQAYVSGVVQACFVRAGFSVYLVNTQTWKKVVCGNGHASKEAIAATVGQRWPTLVRIVQSDQDLIDAAGCYLYGRTVSQHRHQLEGQGTL